MEDLVCDLPLAVGFEQCEQVGEPVTGPVVEFKPHRGDRVNEVDAGDPCLESRRWAVLVIPGKELLDGSTSYCAYAMNKGFLVSIDPEAWTVRDDKLYLNYSLGVRKTWLKDVPGYVKKADVHWTDKVLNGISA